MNTWLKSTRKLTLILCALSFAAAAVAQGDYLGSWKINDYVTINVTTHQFSTGNAYAATGSVLLDIYEDATAGEIVDDTVMGQFDGRTGLYQARVQLLTATGFEAGKHYTCVIAATVDGVAALKYHNFQILASVDTQTLASGSVTAAAIASNAFTSDELATSFIDKILDNTTSNNKVKQSVAWWLQRGGGSDPFVIAGTAQAGGTSNTIVLAAGSSASNSAYIPCTITLLTGTGAPTVQKGYTYTGSTLTLQIEGTWPSGTPNATTTYRIDMAPMSLFAAEGIAQSATANTLTLASGDLIADDLTGLLVLRSGTGSGVTVYTVTDSWDANDTIRISGAWAAGTPDATTYYAFTPSGAGVADIPTTTPGLTVEDIQTALSGQGYTMTLATNIGTTNTRITRDVNDIYDSVDSLEGRLTADRAAKVDYLTRDVNDIYDSVDSLETRLTAARAAKLDYLTRDVNDVYDLVDAISGSYDVDALYDLLWKVWVNLP